MLGSGSWGTALAVHLARVGHDVSLWGRDRAFVADMQRRRANAVYLPEVTFPDGLRPEPDLPVALDRADLVVMAVPSHGFREVARAAAPFVDPAALAVSVTKGLELGSHERMTAILEAEWPRVGVRCALSGPSFAAELARGLPTAVVVASASVHAVTEMQEECRSGALRLYGSDDVVGVELGGALKNVMAIAAGVVEGAGLGHNALAALITRGLAEMSRLVVARGGRRDTLAGLAGLGDLVLTCTGRLSRNRHLGEALARGLKPADVESGSRMVAEGARTAHAALELGAQLGVELPITAQVVALLDGRTDVAGALSELMGRRQRSERDAQ